VIGGIEFRSLSQCIREETSGFYGRIKMGSLLIPRDDIQVCVYFALKNLVCFGSGQSSSDLLKELL
jgi:hypothetical protein